jgi:glycosyltransferase involved in cell wall biosynthesis
MRHIVIIPARNEADHIEQTLRSILRQQERPDRIYVVDDGSTDRTITIVDRICEQESSVILIKSGDRGYRKMGAGVVEVFNRAYNLIRDQHCSYVSKIDADLVMEPNYFRALLDRMDDDPALAIAGGNRYEKVAEQWLWDRTPSHHVPGGLKTMRRSAFDRMGGFIPTLGWDIIDEVKAHMLGYKTVNFPDLKVLHLRPHASAEGVLRGKATWGRGAYIIGSHPLFAFFRGIYRMRERPFVLGGLAFWWGYCLAAIQGEPKIDDKVLIAFLRKEQLQRLFGFNRIKQTHQA